MLGTIQGAMFLLIFRHVFGGAIGSAGIDYVNFLVPGFVTTGILFSGMGAAAAVWPKTSSRASPTGSGRCLYRGAPSLAGRALADTAILVWGIVVTTAIGFAVGFRIQGSVADAFGAVALIVVFGFAFEWVFIALGMLAGNARAAQGLAFMVFPLTFVSSAYVPVQSMPGWLRVFADHQPITYMVDAVRALSLGPVGRAVLVHSGGFYVMGSLLWAAGIVAMFAPLAIARYRRG